MSRNQTLCDWLKIECFRHGFSTTMVLFLCVRYFDWWMEFFLLSSQRRGERDRLFLVVVGHSGLKSKQKGTLAMQQVV